MSVTPPVSWDRVRVVEPAWAWGLLSAPCDAPLSSVLRFDEAGSFLLNLLRRGKGSLEMCFIECGVAMLGVSRRANRCCPFGSRREQSSRFACVTSSRAALRRAAGCRCGEAPGVSVSVEVKVVNDIEQHAELYTGRFEHSSLRRGCTGYKTWQAERAYGEGIEGRGSRGSHSRHSGVQ